MAADAPAPKDGHWIVRDFRFHTGEVLPELRLHYTTIGAPSGEPVLILHGTTGSGTGLPAPAFGGELFGPGQPLDASRYSDRFLSIMAWHDDNHLDQLTRALQGRG
jgi:homoserine O-acetyltransferase/O-succinyltransferase